ncbi:hypothetical protein FRC14_003286 [Serendipita sp. 396]|nr:hypothetical protein FRC14_003286 [Serendipita sp. 396]KAG8783532.1 hypothetical protein FRC15_005004 [Serendipita sp. 397]KAG8821156.1 hypothetical protein FRC18_011426 [Serendipita sp. 400]KAG8823929.1 hypothetical protein FRC19_002854 [Serendipita sp. 401]KAG8848075.1 hypothetical protein FRB91_011202 [Serendipita sp. 411]KAG8869558.1 hypothetical protein FRC20_001239 [Serendipita sp. 405]KAG9053934.1 hypothetical protein FS842_006721 [Serendipita sp. 407]
MSVNTHSKSEYYTQLAICMDELANKTQKYHGLMDKLVQQHKALSSMAIWHSAQFMAVSKLVDDEAEQQVEKEKERQEQQS